MLENLDSHHAAQVRLVFGAKARLVVGEIDHSLRHIAHHDVALQRHAKNPLFAIGHAENEISRPESWRCREKSPQIVSAAQQGLQVARCDEECL